MEEVFPVQARGYTATANPSVVPETAASPAVPGLPMLQVQPPAQKSVLR